MYYRLSNTASREQVETMLGRPFRYPNLYQPKPVINGLEETIAKSFETVEKDDVIFLYQEFGDSSINFQTRFWIASTSALEVAKAKSAAMMAIKDAFDENDINIPFPIRTLDFPQELKLKQEK